jgi:crossover junction endodeoxyribonuclease RuvC
LSLTVCGIDPGLGITGYAVIRIARGAPQLIEGGVCRLNLKESLAERLASLDSDIAAVFSEHQPDVVAVEELYVHYKHPRTAILMGHARGVILLTAARLGIRVASYSATRVKRYLTGNGRASKAQVQRVVQTTLGLSRLPQPADVADAAAIALCCAHDRSDPRHSIRSPRRSGDRRS